MRLSTIFFLTAGLSFSVTTSAQTCYDIFISEYLEGTGNNKGIELFNPTNETIDLSMYTLQRWSNGEAGMTEQVTILV